MSQKIQIAVSVSAALNKVLKTQAKKEKRSVSNLVRMVLMKEYEYLVGLEDLKVYNGKKWIKAPKEIREHYKQAHKMLQEGRARL